MVEGELEECFEEERGSCLVERVGSQIKRISKNVRIWRLWLLILP